MLQKPHWVRWKLRVYEKSFRINFQFISSFRFNAKVSFEVRTKERSNNRVDPFLPSSSWDAHEEKSARRQRRKFRMHRKQCFVEQDIPTRKCGLKSFPWDWNLFWRRGLKHTSWVKRKLNEGNERFLIGETDDCLNDDTIQNILSALIQSQIFYHLFKLGEVCFNFYTNGDLNHCLKMSVKRRQTLIV